MLPMIHEEDYNYTNTTTATLFILLNKHCVVLVNMLKQFFESFQVLFAIGDEMYEKEEEKFLQSEEGKTLSAPYEELLEYFSNHIKEPVDRERMGYLAAGVNVLVRDA